MKTVTVSVRCTREEYIEFCANRSANLWFLTVIGMLLLVVSTALIVWSGTVTQSSIWMMVCGVVATLMSPLILPMLTKGRAAARYDASDSLKLVTTLQLNESNIVIKSATVDGNFSAEHITHIRQTAQMTALVFGKEYQVCIPHRVLTEEEQTILNDLLKIYKKD